MTDITSAQNSPTPQTPLIPRVGTGVDVHAFGEEDTELWIAGLYWPGERGLSGHSDGDVVAHAAADALFAASGTGGGKERIGGRVRNDIAVGMPTEPAFARPVQARDPQLGVFLAKGMHVYAGSYSRYEGGLRGGAVLCAGYICHEGAFHRGCVLSFRSGRIPVQSGRVRALCANRAGS